MAAKGILRLSDTPVIIADNVAIYYAESPQQEWAISGQDFACVAPPFETPWFVEWKEPGYMILPSGRVETGVSGEVGSLFWSTGRAEFDAIRPLLSSTVSPSVLDQSRWLLWVVHFATVRGQAWLVPFWDVVFVGPLGEPLDYATVSELNDDEVFREVERGCIGRLHVTLLTLGFLHCKNVNRLDVSDEECPSPKWCRRQRVPQLKYQVLQIDPSCGANAGRGVRKTVGDRSGKALHICRGHFAHYREDGGSRGLFGRGVFGTFWVPSHARGSLKHGGVVSKYMVHPTNTREVVNGGAK